MEKKRYIVGIYFLIFILISTAYLAGFIYSSYRYATGVKTKANVTDVNIKTIKNHHTKGGSSKSNETDITYEYTDGKDRYVNTVKISGKKDHKKSYLFNEIIWYIMPTMFFIFITIAQIFLYKKFCRPKPDGPKETEEVI